MSDVIPFRALRPQKKLVQAVASLPYDVMSLEEAKSMVENNPLSFLHVERSEVDLSESSQKNAYDLAARNLQKMIDEGSLFQDEKACFYIYRQKMVSHEQYGIVGGVSVSEYETGRIKKHEMTKADKEKDRIDHVSAVNAHTGPVFMTYRSVPNIDKIMEKVVAGSPEYDFVSDNGILHTVWIIDDDKDIHELILNFAKVDTLYIADGHHRAAAAAAVARQRQEQNPTHRGDKAYNHMLAVLFPDNQLRIMEYNRVVKDLNGLGEEEFLSRVGQTFDIYPLFKEKLPRKFHDFDMYLRGRWYRLTPKAGTYDADDLVRRLDVYILQNNLLEPVLGIQNPRTDARIDYVGGIKGVEALEKMVDSGAYTVAFSLFPTTMEQLFAVADAGLIMPPKSTWFEPKLRSGIFVHLI
ncbi:MAG: DUF1015 domain-containing protein [Deltaproteobacteria bacterium]|nr:DUF1015 domain-containing protein [Deltaproteobacteria bacterium]